MVWGANWFTMNMYAMRMYAIGGMIEYLRSPFSPLFLKYRSRNRGTIMLKAIIPRWRSWLMDTPVMLMSVLE